jgi:pimeloyl-ACP methyl ester carboxylesterase
MEEDMRDSLERIPLPTLIIHGEQDQICLTGAAFFLREKLSHAKLLILKGCGHAPFLNNPLQFNKALMEFIHSL